MNYSHSTVHLEIAAAIRRVAWRKPDSQAARRSKLFARQVWAEEPYCADNTTAMTPPFTQAEEELEDCDTPMRSRTIRVMGGGTTPRQLTPHQGIRPQSRPNT